MNTNLRKRVIDEVDLLASSSEQIAYENSLKNAAGHAPTELISGFCDDLYHPKQAEFTESFDERELKDLAHLYGLMIEASCNEFPTVTEMLKDNGWRKVVNLAKRLVDDFKTNT